jgi:hypothetical protein
MSLVLFFAELPSSIFDEIFGNEPENDSNDSVVFDINAASDDENNANGVDSSLTSCGTRVAFKIKDMFDSDADSENDGNDGNDAFIIRNDELLDTTFIMPT